LRKFGTGASIGEILRIRDGIGKGSAKDGAVVTHDMCGMPTTWKKPVGLKITAIFQSIALSTTVINSNYTTF
jgi:hypothetical protein